MLAEAETPLMRPEFQDSHKGYYGIFFRTRGKYFEDVIFRDSQVVEVCSYCGASTLSMVNPS